ncbi:hypothetical protein U1Q18_040348 [Sarracenia purpurea var. burkii]
MVGTCREEMISATDWMLLCVLHFQSWIIINESQIGSSSVSVPTDGFVSLSDAMNCLGNGDIGKTQFLQLICVGLVTAGLHGRFDKGGIFTA